MAGAVALLALACRPAPAPQPWRQPLPFAPERLEALGPLVVASAPGRAVVLDFERGRAVEVPHGVQAADAAAGVVALVDRDLEILSLAAGGHWRSIDLHGEAPREATVSADGACVAVRGEERLLQLPVAAGVGDVVYDRTVDPALPAPTWAAEVWAREHLRPAGARSGAGRTPVRVMWNGRDLVLAVDGATLVGPPACALPVLAVERLPSGAEPLVVAVPAPAPGDHLRAFLERHAHHPQAASLWGEVARRRRDAGDGEGAMAAFQVAASVAASGPDRDRSLDLELVEMLRQRGDHEAAVAEIDRLLARLSDVPRDPVVFEASLLKAETLSERLHRPSEAIPIYRRLVADYEAFFPMDATFMRRDKARLYLGMALERTGNAPEARAQYVAIIDGSVTGTFVRYARERLGRLGGSAR